MKKRKKKAGGATHTISDCLGLCCRVTVTWMWYRLFLAIEFVLCIRFLASLIFEAFGYLVLLLVCV